MDVLTEEQHRAIAFLHAANEGGYAPSHEEVEAWLHKPVLANYFIAGPVTGYVVAPSWDTSPSSRTRRRLAGWRGTPRAWKEWGLQPHRLGPCPPGDACLSATQVRRPQR